MPVLAAHNLTKSVPGGRCLLRDISFEVNTGELVGVLGASGAGKSLTMRSLLGLIRPDSGTVELNAKGRSFCVTAARGRELREARKEMGAIFQGLHLVQRLSVLDNVMIGRLGAIHPLRSWLYGFTDAEARAAMEVLDHLQLTHLAARMAGTLSGGELQRVAIGRAVFQDPSIFLADEPISSLDPKTAEHIMQLLSELSRTKPVLCSLHQPDMARAFCTRVIGIRNGEVVYEGAPLLSSSTLRDIYGAEAGQMRVVSASMAPVAAGSAIAGAPA